MRKRRDIGSFGGSSANGKTFRPFYGLFVLICLLSLLAAPSAHADRPAALSAQTITRPSGPSSLKGLGESFSPNIATGTGNFSVPLSLPPGILAPELSLSYSAGKGKGPVGTSFHLPVLNIYRATDKGLPRFTEDDRFSVEGPTLNDELVLVNAQKRWYRLRNEGAFARFERHAADDNWTIRLPNGQTLELGTDEEHRQAVGGKTARWFVARHADRFGHEVRYSYFEDHGRVYPSEIRYQLHAPAEFQNAVVFEYEERRDILTDYTYGAAVVTAKRLVGVEMHHGSRKLRRYDLTYEDALLGSLLSSVTMTGENGEQMPTLTFSYVQPSTKAGRLIKLRSLPPLEGLEDGRTTFEDLNGDALPDLLIGEAGRYRYYENLDGEHFAETPTELLNSPDRSLTEEGCVLADIDGDGFRDVVYRHDQAFRYHPAGEIKDGVLKGFEPARTLAIGWQPDFTFTASNVKLSDVNHDGRVDLLYQKPGRDEVIYNLETDALTSEYIEELPWDVDFTDPRVEMTDVNGDGLLDFVRKQMSYEGSRIRVWMGKGGGRYEAEQDMLRVPKGDASEFFVQDVNHDGQADLLRISGSWLTYYLNDGKLGFTGAQASVSNLPAVGATRKILFADMNGNGTTDVLWLGVDYSLSYLDLFGEPNFGLLGRVDNGMGMVTEIDYRSSTSYAIDDKLAGEPWKTPLPTAMPVISEIRVNDSFALLGLDANVSRTTFSYRDGYYDGKEREFRGFARATSKAMGNDHHPTQVTETWMHVGRNLETGADEEVLKGKPWLQLTKDAQGHLFTSVETRWEQRWMCQEDIEDKVSVQILPRCAPVADKQKNKEKLIAHGVQTSALTGIWEQTRSPKWTATAASHNAWGAVVRLQNYGEVGIAGDRQPGEPFDLAEMDLLVGEDENVSESDFIYNIDEWLLGITYQSRVTDLGGKLVGQTRTYFDGPAFEGLGLGEVTNGLVTRSEAWLKEPASGEERWISAKRVEYNTDGLVVATKDAKDNLVELDYDADTRMLPIAERFLVDVGPLEFTAAYDAGTGAITSATDLNGNTTQYAYDGLGRLLQIVDPMSTSALPTARYTYEYGTPDWPLSTTKVESLIDRDEGIYRTSYIYSDGLGRTRLTKAQAEMEHGGWLASGWSLLSPRGTATHVYDSFKSEVPDFEAAPSTAPVTESLFDALGRAVQVFPPATAHGLTSTVTQYFPFETRVYDEQDTKEGTWLYPATTLVDGLGRVREIIKHNDLDGVFTRLSWQVEYDTAGNIKGFIDPKGNRREYTYDSLGRMQSVDDPNAGHLGYDYDDVGNLVRREDSLGQVQQWQYGAANRLLRFAASNDAHDAADYEYNYSYDVPSAELPSAKNLLGKLSQASWPTGTIQFSYDALDRLTTEVQTLWDGTSPFADQKRDTYRSDFAYNAAGQVTSQDVPGGLHLKFDYNTRSLLEEVSGGFKGDLRAIFGSIRYDHRGATIQTDARNGIRQAAWYDNRARLLAIQAGPIDSVRPGYAPTELNPDAVQHLLFHRTPTGLISQIDDLTEVRPGIPRFNASYQYDRLYQLVDAQTAEGNLSWSYDTIQNLVRQGADDQKAQILRGAFNYGEGEAGPNQITSADGQTFKYNAVGQMKQYHGFDLRFDVEGRLVGARKPGGSTLEYHYDDTGARKLAIVKRPGGPAKVLRYINGAYQIRDGEQTWNVGGGLGQVEIKEVKGLRPQLTLIDELARYAADPEHQKKPLPEELMDLDGDGDGFDLDDLQTAIDGYWAETTAGKAANKIWRYTLKDHLGGSNLVTDSRGAVVSHLKYHPYGQIASQSGQAPTYGFAGGEIEEERELGLVQFGARWYAPEIGRWVSADPLYLEVAAKNAAQAMSSGLYGYVSNDPINSVDPSGMEDNPPPQAGCAGDSGCIGRINREQQAGWTGIGNFFISGLELSANVVSGGGSSDSREDNGVELPRVSPPQGETPEESQHLANVAKNTELAANVATVAYGVVKAGTALLRAGKAGLAKLKSATAAVDDAAFFSAEAPKSIPAAKGGARLPQDVAVNPTAPRALPLNRPIGRSPSQNTQVQTDIAAARTQGATDFRVNQQQVNAQGQRVGVNRPDLQYTDANGARQYFEYDTPTSGRGPGHQSRIQANDPGANVTLKVIP